MKTALWVMTTVGCALLGCGGVESNHAAGGHPGSRPDAGTETPEPETADSGVHRKPKGPPTEHRATAETCTPTPLESGLGNIPCTTNTDCEGFSAGPCHLLVGSETGLCLLDTCAVDGDCAPGELCACGVAYRYGNSPHNQCVSATCRVDSDCGPEGTGYCSPSPSRCGGVPSYYCHEPADECTTDADCGDRQCVYDPAVSYWTCQYNFCNG